MKKILRSTLLCDFIGAVFCLVTAFVLVLMCTGCGDDHLTGGTAEETNIVASLSNITVLGRVKNINEILEANNVDADSEKMIARMFELDSVTLDTVGKYFYGSYDNRTGEFRFDSVSVNSPYALIEISSYKEDEYWSKDLWKFEDYNKYCGCFSVRAIVDLRKTAEVNINALTYLESFRIVSLAQSGMSYAEAKNKADRDILDAFGFFKNSLDFAHLEISNPSDSIAVDYITGYIVSDVDVVVSTVGKNGSFDKWPDSEKETWIVPLLKSLEGDVITSSTDILWIRAKSNFVAVLLGLGECSEGMEDSVYETSYNLYNLVCNSGNWGLAKNVPVIYSADTLVDPRDGKKYKLVTYEIGDSSQTWMAEDLMFNSSDGIYPYPDAIAMDSSVVINSYEGCDEYWRDLSERMGENVTFSDTALIDSSMIQSPCYGSLQNKGSINNERFWPAVDSVVAEKGSFQGICPDGWRLPSAYEWESLMQKIADTFVDTEEEYAVLRAPEYFELAGFGPVLRQDGDNPWREREEYYAMAPDSSYRAPGFSSLVEPTVTFIRFVFEYWDIWPREYWDILPRGAGDNDVGSVVRVRCIKE